MRIRRRTYGSWTPESSAKAHAAKARKRMEGALRPPAPPKPLLRGVLQWTGADGEVHRWVIRPGKRHNGITVCAKGTTVQCGYDRLFRAIRKRILLQPRAATETARQRFRPPPAPATLATPESAA